MNLTKKSYSSTLQEFESESAQHNKSTYCDYNTAFIGYDEIRHPCGVNSILNILRQSNVSLDEQQVLEGGFGTGAYLDRIRHHVKKIYGVEGSDEGYRQARQKVKNATNVYLQIGNILRLPFTENFFDAYLVNQVIHHLDHTNGFPQLDVFLVEAVRVLKPGGYLVINTCTQEQLEPDAGSYWHYKYFPGAARAIQERYIPLVELEARLQSLGFTNIKGNKPAKKIFFPEYYQKPYIALQPEFRQGDSVYSFFIYGGS